jgi:hypothetical protein
MIIMIRIAASHFYLSKFTIGYQGIKHRFKPQNVANAISHPYI